MIEKPVSRRSVLRGFALAGTASWAGCSKGGGGRTSEKTYQMGERAQVGPLIYTVLETDWLAEIPGASSPRIPKNKFLRIQMTVFNSSNREISVPMLRLEDPEGVEHMEISDGEGVTEWLGFLRHVSPSETLQGGALFDVKQAEYKLRVSDGGEPDREITALVHIPLVLEERRPFEAVPKL